MSRPVGAIRRAAVLMPVLVLAACGGGDGGVRPVDLPSAAESNCRAAVAAETGSGSVRILNSSASTVTIRGPGGNWTCRANSAGEVLSLSRAR